MFTLVLKSERNRPIFARNPLLSFEMNQLSIYAFEMRKLEETTKQTQVKNKKPQNLMTLYIA